MANPVRELRPKDNVALKVMEGNVPYVYDDSVYPTRKYKRGAPVGGTLTGGVGHTGKDVLDWIGKDIPASQIDAWLDADTDVSENFINNNVHVKLNNNQFAALVFWVFNIGTGAAAKSTLVRKLNAGDFDSVPNELRKWTKTTINGKRITSNGLIKRRADEIVYWLADQKNIPEVVPRPDDKPTGTQVAEREVTQYNPIEIASGAGAIVGPAAGFANSTGAVAIAFAVVIVVAVVVVGALVVKRQFFSK